jgi:acyl-CoA thioesterase II
MATPIGPETPLAHCLTVERSADGEWTTEVGDLDWGASFGGDLLARAALAAARDVGGDAVLTSVHAQFLGPAEPGARAALHVARLASEPRTARRRVALDTESGPALELVASFAAPAGGTSFQAGTIRPIAAPETLPSDVELARADGWPARFLAPIEFRRAEPRAWPFPGAADGEPARWSGWLRPRVPLPADDLALHAAALVFASDYRSHWGIEVRLGPAFSKHAYTSVNHAVWIHATLPWTDWWCFETHADVGRDGRVLTAREVWTRDGVRVATIAQEGRITPLG